MTTFLVMRRVGPAWDASLPIEEQSDWPAHADYIDELVENGVVALGPRPHGRRVRASQPARRPARERIDGAIGLWVAIWLLA